MIDWLLSPVDPGRVHDVGAMLSWHGRVMLLAWGVLIPLGVLIARYFKVTPKQDWPIELDNRFWWRSHLLLQNLGIALTLAGAALVWFAPRHLDQAGIHRYFGWVLVCFGLAQLLGGYFRGTKGGPTAPAPDGSLNGDHFDMTPRRVFFEWAHKLTGYGAILLSAFAIVSGLWQANAPGGFFVLIGVWWTLLMAAGAALQRRGMAIDTYQAIWGPDPELPGNRRLRSIGIGVHRILPQEKGPAARSNNQKENKGEY